MNKYEIIKTINEDITYFKWLVEVEQAQLKAHKVKLYQLYKNLEREQARQEMEDWT